MDIRGKLLNHCFEIMWYNDLEKFKLYYLKLIKNIFNNDLIMWNIIANCDTG